MGVCLLDGAFRVYALSAQPVTCAGRAIAGVLPIAVSLNLSDFVGPRSLRRLPYTLLA